MRAYFNPWIRLDATILIPLPNWFLSGSCFLKIFFSIINVLRVYFQSSFRLTANLREIHRDFLCILEKAMAPHSSTLAWKIPWMEEPGGLQSLGLLGVGHDWATSLTHFPDPTHAKHSALSTFTAIAFVLMMNVCWQVIQSPYWH